MKKLTLYSLCYTDLELQMTQTMIRLDLHHHREKYMSVSMQKVTH